LVPRRRRALLSAPIIDANGVTLVVDKPSWPKGLSTGKKKKNGPPLPTWDLERHRALPMLGGELCDLEGLL
jgi:hypothetical protein